MSFLSGVLNNQITIWKSSGLDRNGNPSFSAPELVDARFERKSETFRTNTGEEKRAEGRAYFMLDAVSQPIRSEDKVAIGDNTGVYDPTTLEDVLTVEDVSETPDLSNNETLVKLVLV